MSYASILEALGERFHASPALLKALNPGAAFAAGERIEVPNVERTPLAGVAKVIVDQSDRAVIALDAGGKVIARYPATMGSEHDPLPVGEWKINGVSRATRSSTTTPTCSGTPTRRTRKAKIAARPQQPGRARVDRPVEGALRHPRHAASPTNVGKTQSHGCIRLTNWDALRARRGREARHAGGAPGVTGDRSPPVSARSA